MQSRFDKNLLPSEQVNTITLFRRYPLLECKLPYVRLCELPTPVHRIGGLEDDPGLQHVYIKRDDLTASIYGGNKVR